MQSVLCQTEVKTVAGPTVCYSRKFTLQSLYMNGKYSIRVIDSKKFQLPCDQSKTIDKIQHVLQDITITNCRTVACKWTKEGMPVPANRASIGLASVLASVLASGARTDTLMLVPAGKVSACGRGAIDCMLGPAVSS